MKNKVILFILWAMLSLGLYAQSGTDSLLASFAQKGSTYPPELIYIQTSKDIYETGEDLWFKAYQLDAQSFGLSDKSKTLYLQLINPQDSVVWQEKYPIENGIVFGHVYVNEKLPEGDYLLEGYTRYSFYKNDTTGILPVHKIKIVKNISRSVATETPKDTTFRFAMFPEGGNLVSDIPSRLAFKATDGKGNPVFVEGTLFQDGEPLNEIKSVHDGMGMCIFTPLPDRKYRIELKDGRSYPLPDIHSEGMALRLSKQDEKRLDFIVSQSDGLPNQEIYLVGQMRGMLCCMAKGVLKDNLKISIPLDNFLYQGIAEFTLFNSSMQPIAERLVYVHPERKLHITIEPEKRNFTLREKGTIQIKVTNEEGKPVRANLGITVYDQAYHNPANSINILSHCYLSSQIRGKIYDPTYYFDEKNNGRTEGMELLLLTQGWRRYIWNMECPVYKGEPFLTDEINGVQFIQRKKKGEQNQGTKQLIQVSSAEGNALFVWADSTGRFTVGTDMMKELRGGYMYMKPMLSKEFKPALEIVDYFSQIDSIRKNRRHYYPMIDLSLHRKEIEFDSPVVSSDSTILLNEVVVTGKGGKLFRDKFMGRLDSLAQMDLNGAWVCDCGSQTRNGYLNDYMGYSHHPAGSPCPPIKKVSAPVNGKDYELIKYEPKGENGIWIVTDIKVITYNGPEFSEEELLRMNNLWRTKGYYAAREFYQPDEVDMQLSMPDARNTLLWQPSVITDEKGEATVSFHCSDINTGFVGVVEGTDGAGLLGNGNCEFRVVRVHE